MHRIVYTPGLASTSIIAAALAISGTSSATEDLQTLADEPLIEAYAEDDESEAGIAKLPNIEGDRESYRRNMLARAWKEKRNISKPEHQRFADMYEWTEAADGIRSSTFTRCNLGLLAHELGRAADAAKYFQRELQKRYPHDGSKLKKMVRDVCEIMGRLALLRVSELNIVAPERSQVWVDKHILGKAPLASSVFLKPNEDHVVRVQLDDGRELRETVSLGAGESRTLELKSTRVPRPMIGGLPMLPRRGEPSAAELLWMSAKPPEPKAKTAALWMGIGVGAVGLIMGAVGAGWEISTNQKIDTTTVDGKKTCREEPYGKDICITLNSNLKTANLLGYLGGATLGLGATGLLIYALYPEPRPGTKTIAETLPSGLGVKGTF